MATRLYPIPITLDANVPTITPAYDSLWERTGEAVRRFVGSKATGTYYETAITYRSLPSPYGIARNLLLAQLITRPLKAQTISGTFKGVYQVWSNSSYQGIYPQMTMKVVSGDGSTVRGVLYAGMNPLDTGNNFLGGYYDSLYTESEWMQPALIGSGGTPITLNEVTCQEGDRIVIETGGYDNYYTWTNNGFSINLANNSTSPYNDINPDSYAGYVWYYANSQQPAMWMEFSQTLDFIGALSGNVSQVVNLGGTLAPRNLVTNSTFETVGGIFTSSGWTPGSNNNPLAASDLNAGRNGSLYALKMTRTSATPGNAYAQVTVSGLVSGQKYRVDGWVKKISAGADIQVDIQIAAAFTSSTYTIGTEWTKISRIFTAAATSYIFYVRMGQTVAALGDTLLLDDFAVYKYTTYEPFYSSNLLQVPVEMSATPTLTDNRTFVGDATTDMIDVSMQAEATIATAIPMVGTMDVDVQMSSGQMQVEAPLTGTMAVPVDLDVTVLNMQEIGAANNPTLTLTTTPGQPAPYTTVGMVPISIEMDTSATNRIMADVYIPPDPEAATPGTPAVAQGVYVRALHGVIVDMPTPAITDGKPT